MKYPAQLIINGETIDIKDLNNTVLDQLVAYFESLS